MAGHSGGCPCSLVKALQAARLGPCSCRGAVGGDAPPHGSLPDIRVRAPSRSPAMAVPAASATGTCSQLAAVGATICATSCGRWRCAPLAPARERTARPQSCSIMMLSVVVRVTRRTPEAAASWPNRRSSVAAAAGMALGPPTPPQEPKRGCQQRQRIWAREIPTRLLLLAFGRSGRPDLPLRPNDTADRTRTCSNMFPFSYVNSNVQPDLRWRD